MTIVLILAALAAVYYIAPLAEAASKPGIRPPPETEEKPQSGPDSPAILTPGLLALGRALDQYGRGTEPAPGKPREQAHWNRLGL
jgi:hypothetical protein